MPASFLLTDSLNWKYLGSVSGKNSITYPEDAQYLRCDVYFLRTSQANHYVAEIDLRMLSSDRFHYFVSGYYYTNTDYSSNNIAVYTPSRNVYLLLNSLAGNDNSAACTMDVWYR